MLKIAVICYHSNLYALYPETWIIKFRDSILNQTHKTFDIWELNYSGGNERIFINSIFESKHLPSFVDAMNYLIDIIFSKGYDCVVNTNCDDFYALNRIEKQIESIKAGYDAVSSNFALIRDDVCVHVNVFDKLDISQELNNGHNPVCHPSIILNHKFWKQNRYVPSEIPFEDMLLWKRAIKNGNTFIILPEILCFHRLHNNSVCQNENNR